MSGFVPNFWKRTPPQRLERLLVEGLQPAPFHLPLELLTPRCGVLPNAVLAQQAVHAHGARHGPNHVRPPPASQIPKTASPPLPLSGWPIHPDQSTVDPLSNLNTT